MQIEEHKSTGRPRRWLRAILLLALPVAAILTITVGSELFRSYEECRRMGCAVNLKQLGLLCYAYAEENDGAFPSRWSDLKSIDHATNAQFYCPASGHAAGNWEGVDLWADYRLTPNLTTNVPPDTVLAIEPLANHDAAGANVLFADGHVAWWTASQITNWRLRATSPAPNTPEQ